MSKLLKLKLTIKYWTILLRGMLSDIMNDQNPIADGILCIIIAKKITSWNIFSFLAFSAYETHPNETPSATEWTTSPISVTKAECKFDLLFLYYRLKLIQTN